MTAEESKEGGTREISESVEIDAPRDVVWRAITEAGRVANWFAPNASGRAGPGGHLTVSWGAGAEWTSHFVRWEPPRHLRLVDTLPDEDPVPDGTTDPGSAMALDYRMEEVAGRTRLHLVNSGLSRDPSWDDAVRMMTNGWRFFLWNLKHYLERHPESRRTMIGVRPWVTGTRADVWERLFGAQGIIAIARTPFALRLDGLARHEGNIVLCDRPWAFAGVISSLNDGVLHVEMEGSGERWKMGIWLSTYGLEEARCDGIRKALKRTIGRLFPEQEE